MSDTPSAAGRPAPSASQAGAAEAPSPGPARELISAIHELTRIVVGEKPLDEVFAQVVQLARREIPGADEVSVTMVDGSGATTPAATGELACTLDEQQYSTGQGPCLQAATTGETLHIPDMQAEQRWPEYTPFAARNGGLSSLSVPLPVQDTTVGALNIYARVVDAFDEHSRELAEHFAGYAAVTVRNASLYTATTNLAEQMQAAMESRAVIEQAKGIIMGERRCSPDEAFRLLSKVSQDANRKLRDVATAFVAQAYQSS
ncbi:GAF and ANTAR domain-containing protein [Rhodococcus sp. X156]|uniref:GAF and ANTAR domain-containing protein n=1 Tax=Rhodococcus sp. X156 TaxID=2499145 RepID=UPI000FD80C9B|nr:GAF and ANTAR domain-containing protein [Rhodococcus sp. X156]